MLLVVLFAGLFAGLVSGVAGLGASIVALPFLLYGPELVGVEPLSIQEVTGLTIVQSFAVGMVNLTRHRAAGNVHSPLVFGIGIPAGVASLAGALISTRLPDTAILATMAAMTMSAAAILLFPRVFFRRRIGGLSEMHEGDGWRPGDPAPEFHRVWAGLMGAAVGMAGGVSGLPGAFLVVPLLIFALGVPTRLAIGSNLGIVLFISGAALVGKLVGAQVPAVPGLVLVATAVGATVVGFEVNHRLTPRHLRGLIGIIVAATAARVLIDVFV